MWNILLLWSFLMGWKHLLEPWTSIWEDIRLKIFINCVFFSIPILLWKKTKVLIRIRNPVQNYFALCTLKKTAQYPHAIAGWHQSMKVWTQQIGYCAQCDGNKWQSGLVLMDQPNMAAQSTAVETRGKVLAVWLLSLMCRTVLCIRNNDFPIWIQILPSNPHKKKGQNCQVQVFKHLLKN